MSRNVFFQFIPVCRIKLSCDRGCTVFFYIHFGTPPVMGKNHTSGIIFVLKASFLFLVKQLTSERELVTRQTHFPKFRNFSD